MRLGILDPIEKPVAGEPDAFHDGDTDGDDICAAYDP